ncbi:MAG: hypothetical protein J7M08_02015 [Planctomycetes bacterium]|nr:hypothetical protein [Planctomycetota bacterium]
MSDERMTPEHESPAGAVPESLSQEIAALRNETVAMARAASRSWKITGIVFVIVVAVIATYMGFIRRGLKQYLSADAVVQMGVNRLDDVLSQHGAPSVTSGEWANWVSDRLEEKAPEWTEDFVRPQIEQLQKSLPQMRKQLVEKFKAQGAAYVDSTVDWAVKEGLPDIRKKVLAEMEGQANDVMDNLEAQLGIIVLTALQEHQDNLKNLRAQDWSQYRVKMEAELERELGPILDEAFPKIENAIVSVEQQTEGLVAAYEAGQLAHEQELEVQLIRVIRALFKGKAVQQTAGAGGI